MPLTILDIGLIAIMLLSGLLAMMRGFTREVLSIASWGAAAGAAVFAYTKFKDVARAEIQPQYLADGVLIGGVFLLVLIIVSFITARVSDAILDSKIGALDRTLGFAFGVGRGLLIVVIAYLFFTWLVPETSQPNWVKNAKSREILTKTADAIMRQLPEDPEKWLERLRRPRGNDEGPADQPPSLPPQTQPGPAQPQRTNITPTDRQGLNQILTGAQPQPTRP